MIHSLDTNMFGSEANYEKYQRLQSLKKGYRKGEVSLSQLMGASDEEEKTDTEKCVDSLYQACTALNKRGNESLFRRKEDGAPEKAVAAANTFISAYNELLKAGSSDESEAVARNTAYLMGLVESCEEQLGHVGIYIDEDGLLSMDGEKMKASDLADQRKVFVGNDSVVGKMQQKLFEIALAGSGASTDTTGTYGKKGTYEERPSTHSIFDSMQ